MCVVCVAYNKGLLTTAEAINNMVEQVLTLDDSLPHNDYMDKYNHYTNVSKSLSDILCDEEDEKNGVGHVD